MRWLRRALVVGSTTWAGALPLATFAAAQAQPTPSAYLGALAIYAIGGAICHQLEPRSFHLWGRQMPVCARCTGIYAGAAVGAVLAAARPRAVRLSPRWMVAVATAPIAVSVLVEWTTGVATSNRLRCATGLVAGLAMAWVLVAGLREPREADNVVN
jgi:uncharacterized membrane protein